MFLKYLLLFSLLFLKADSCLSQDQSFFDQLKKTESISQPCSCNCHGRVYSYKECIICAHSGGKFYTNDAHINIEDHNKKGKNHE